MFIDRCYQQVSMAVLCRQHLQCDVQFTVVDHALLGKVQLLASFLLQ